MKVARNENKLDRSGNRDLFDVWLDRGQLFAELELVSFGSFGVPRCSKNLFLICLIKKYVYF